MSVLNTVVGDKDRIKVSESSTFIVLQKKGLIDYIFQDVLEHVSFNNQTLKITFSKIGCTVFGLGCIHWDDMIEVFNEVKK